MRVRDVLAHKGGTVVSITPEDKLEAAASLLMDRGVGGLPVRASDGSVVGFLAERDIVRAVRDHHGRVHHLTVRDVMRPPPSCDADDPLDEVMRRMTVERHRHLVVRDNEGVRGVISLGDLVKNRLQQLETEAGVLRDYVAAHRASH